MTFIPNPAFIPQLRSEDETKQELEFQCQRAADYAKVTAIGFMPNKREGRQIAPVWEGNDLYLTNFDHGGHLEEFGSANNPPYATLRNAVRAAGFDLTEE